MPWEHNRGPATTPPVPLVIAWRAGPGHPAVPDLVALAHAILAE
ncbi:hypothetical protein [Streptomyces flavofungini]